MVRGREVSKRRKKWWIALTTFLSLTAAMTVGIATRKRSQFGYLYALGPQVGSYVPLITPRPHDSRTMLVFRPSDADQVRKLVASKFRFVYEGTSRSRRTATGPVTSECRTMFDGKTELSILSGIQGEALAKVGHMKLDPGGCLVTISEPPDWFTVKIGEALRFLHLR